MLVFCYSVFQNEYSVSTSVDHAGIFRSNVTFQHSFRQCTVLSAMPSTTLIFLRTPQEGYQDRVTFSGIFEDFIPSPFPPQGKSKPSPNPTMFYSRNPPWSDILKVWGGGGGGGGGG